MSAAFLTDATCGERARSGLLRRGHADAVVGIRCATHPPLEARDLQPGLLLAVSSVLACRRVTHRKASRRHSVRQCAQSEQNQISKADGPCYRVEQVKDKGRGVVAVRDIAVGELIIAETPRDESFKGPICSTLNHSCGPNCQLTLDQATNVLTLYAVTDISAGDELCHHYIDIRQPRAARLQDLTKANPGGATFHCLCPACTSASEESDLRRKEMVDMKFHASSAKDLSSKIQSLRRLSVLYDEEGLHIPRERKMACYFAFQVALELEDFADAAHWVEQAHKYALLGCGEDHADTKMLLSYWQKMQRSPGESPL